MVTLGGGYPGFWLWWKLPWELWGGIHVNLGPHQDTTSSGDPCAHSAIIPHYLPFPAPSSSLGKGERTPAPTPEIPTHRGAFVPGHGGAGLKWQLGPWTCVQPLPASSLAPSWPETTQAASSAFPAFVPGLAEESLPELPAILESVMKSPACRRKGLCLYGWWGSMPGCA